MPIRLRLTLWYCLIFGLLLMTITSVIYIAHRQSHYNEMDRVLTSVSLHFQEELERDIRNGESLSQVQLSSQEFSLTGVYAVVKDPMGQKVASNAESVRAPDFPFSNFHKITNESLHSITDPELGHYRMLIKPIRIDNQLVGYVQTEISLNRLDTSLYRFGWLIAGITVIGLVLVSFGGWFLARKALHRVEIISQTAKAIAASLGFQQRVLHRGPKDELGELVETFNDMLESLEKAYVSQRRFIADASHELRAPLTTIRGNLDIMQKIKNMPQHEQNEIIEDSRNEAIRMSKMVADLLSLARADAGQEIHMQVTDLSKILKEVEMEVHTWEKKALVECQAADRVTTWGDPDLLKQLLLILMENAIRYTPQGGTVLLAVYEEAENAIIRVTDTGIGIESNDLLNIFDRFYRSESARAAAPEGTGLGLSIAKWIVDQHNGSIVVTSRAGQGTEFKVHLSRLG